MEEKDGIPFGSEIPKDGAPHHDLHPTEEILFLSHLEEDKSRGGCVPLTTTEILNLPVAAASSTPAQYNLANQHIGTSKTFFLPNLNYLLHKRQRQVSWDSHEKYSMTFTHSMLSFQRRKSIKLSLLSALLSSLFHSYSEPYVKLEFGRESLSENY